MKIIEIQSLPNGAHRNQSWEGKPPEGYAVLPDYMNTPGFPFGEIEVVDADGILTVTAWSAVPIPEPEPTPPPEPTAMDKLQAQVTYTALKTNTLIGGK